MLHFSFACQKTTSESALQRRRLKAPPVNPRVYIYRYYNTDPKEGLKYGLKYVIVPTIAL